MNKWDGMKGIIKFGLKKRRESYVCMYVKRLMKFFERNE